MELNQLTENQIVLGNKIVLLDKKYELAEERTKMTQVQFTELRDLVVLQGQKMEELRRDFRQEMREAIELIGTRMDERFAETDRRFGYIDRKLDDQIKIMKSEFIWPVIITGASLFVASWFAPMFNKWLETLIH